MHAWGHLKNKCNFCRLVNLASEPTPMSKTISFADVLLARQEKYLPDRTSPNTRTAVRVTEDGLVWAIDLAMIVLNTNSLMLTECMLGDWSGLFTSRNIQRCLHTDGRKTQLLTLEDAVLLVMTLLTVNTQAFLASVCATLTEALTPQKSNKRKRESDESKSVKKISYIICTNVDRFPDYVLLTKTDDIPATLTEISLTGPRLLAMVPTYHPIRDEKVTHAFFNEHKVGCFFKTSLKSVQSLFKCIKAGFDEEHEGSK